jgi:hypothetical protein
MFRVQEHPVLDAALRVFKYYCAPNCDPAGMVHAATTSCNIRPNLRYIITYSFNSWGYHSGVAAESGLLEWYTVTIGK